MKTNKFKLTKIKYNKENTLKAFDLIQNNLNTLIGKNGTNPDNAVEVINQTNDDLNKLFNVENIFSVKLKYTIDNGLMQIAPNNKETEKLFDKYWKIQSQNSKNSK